MGLDQYWFADKRTKEEKLENLIQNEEPYLEEIGYHRKFWELQKFIDTDNCETIQVEEHMIADLKDWCNETLVDLHKIKDEDNFEEYNYQQLAEILEHIEECLDKGYLVFYSANW